VTPLDETDFDRLLREAMQTAPEHPPIANLAARAMQRAAALNSGVLARDVVRLARYSLIHQVLTAFTAAAVIAFALFTADHLSLTSTFGMTETNVPAARAANDALDISQVLQSEQLAVTVTGMALVLSVFLVAHLVLSTQPPMVMSRKITGSSGIS
jgi:hypothetical protein